MYITGVPRTPANVPLPETGKLQFFYDSTNDDIPSTKDDAGVIRALVSGVISPEYSNIVTVASTGADYNNIKDAIASITDASDTKPYSILVYPGIYSEQNPIQAKGNITLKSVGGENVVKIEAANAGENLFDLVGSFFVQDITVKDVSGVGKYAFEYIGGSTGACLLEDVLFEDCINGLHLDNAAGQIILRNASFQGTMTTSVFVEAGNLSESNLSVVGFATIVTLMNITGPNSVATLNNVSSFSGNLATGLFIQDQATIVMNTSSFVGMTDGIVLEGGASFRAVGLTIFNAQQDGIRINDVGSNTKLACQGCTILDSVRYDFNALSATSIITGVGETSMDNMNFSGGSKMYAGIIDTKEDDEGFNILGELHVGLPEAGAESALGEGDSYTRGMLVYTRTSGGTFLDISEEARSASASTFGFPSNIADSAIYIASSLANASDVLDHFGIKTKVNTAAVVGAGEIVIEYWDGSIWAPIEGMEADSNGSYYPHGNNYFQDTGGHHIRYDLNLAADGWTKNDPITPAIGTDYFWIRFRIETTIDTAPVFEQFKLHTNRFEVNTDGRIEYFGKARPIGQLPLTIGGDKSFSGNVSNQTLYINEAVASGLVENNFTTVGTKIGRYFFLPLDLDTSTPIILKLAGRASGNGTVGFTIRWYGVTEGDPMYTSDPGLLPGLKSTSSSETVTTGDISIFSFDLDVSNLIARREGGEPDFIGLSIEADTLTGSNFALSALEATYAKRCEGGHI